MCGICGVKLYKNANAFEKVCAILEEQKHRGQASTGMAYFAQNRLVISKDIVSPIQFKEKRLSTGGIVIGHNRMPSHGGITLQNSHPFMSCDGKFAFLHNGSEDTSLMKDLMIKLGHKIDGDTDSEVICHAIEEFAKKDGLADAIVKVHESYDRSVFLILTSDGEIYGIGDACYIIRDDEGIYIASEEESFAALFDGKKKNVYNPDGLFRITADNRLLFRDDFEKEKKKIERYHPEKTIKGKSYLGGWWDKRKKKDEQDDWSDEDWDEEFDKMEANKALKKGEFCDCAESEMDFGSGICNRCKKYVEGECGTNE